jgi:hypothetical protein
LSSPAGFILLDIKNFLKHTLLKIFFSFDVASYQKVVSIMFFEDLYSLLDFVVKLILKTPKSLLENTNKEATYRTAFHMKNSSKFFKNRIMQKHGLCYAFYATG